MHHNVGVTHGAWTQGRIRPNGAKMKISVTRSLMARICGLPAIGEKTVARSIFDLRQANNSLVSTPRKPCFVVPQVLISPEESSPEEVSKQKVDGFDPMSFHTLRFRKCEGKSLSYTGKCLVDVRGYVRKAVTNPHKISHSQCLGNAFPEFFSSLLKVHHYSGSFETFATHRGNSLEEVSEIRATLRRMYRATYFLLTLITITDVAGPSSLTICWGRRRCPRLAPVFCHQYWNGKGQRADTGASWLGSGQ